MTLERLGVLKEMHDVCDDVRDFSCIHSLRRFSKSSFYNDLELMKENQRFREELI